MSPDRYAQCDDTCTVDCGACKGAGRPTADTGALREAIARVLRMNVADTAQDADRAVTALLAGPLRDLIAERDRAVAAVERVRRLAEDFDANGNSRELGDPRATVWHEAAMGIRRAIDGSGEQ